MKLEYIVTTEEKMLKEFILEMGVSRNLARKIKLYGQMYINSSPAKNFYVVKPGDKVTLVYNEAMNDEISTVSEDILVHYEDDYLLVLEKEHNLASHPTKKHQDDNLLSRIKNYFLKNNISSNIHLVNRLDFSTSGLLVVAKDGYAHYELTRNDKIKITRKYLAIVEGILDKKEDRIILNIDRESPNSVKRVVREDGKKSITNYKVLAEYENESLIELNLETGRTHQIRVTMAYLNHPVVGDKLYGHEKERLMLHCYYVEFFNPFTKKQVKIKKFPSWNISLKMIEKESNI